jgi:curved DNA-binding protein CbpA
MACPFALLGLSRRPFLSDEEIGTAYRKLAGELHPDQEGGDAEKFRALGEAAVILRDPAKRLKEFASNNSGNQLPAAATDLFPQVAAVLQQADSLIEKYSLASNALSKALLSAPLKALALDLRATLSSIRIWRSSLEQELNHIDAAWPSVDGTSMNLLADCFAYAARWERELRERELFLDSILS